MKRQWTIAAKLRLLSALLLFNALAIGGISFWNLKRLDHALEDQVHLQFPAVQNMTKADMFHDGIRANALAAIVASGSKDAKEVEEIRKEAEEFRKAIREHLETLEKLPISAAQRQALNESKPDLDAYVAAHEKVVDQALAGDLDSAMKSLVVLKEKFEILEGKFDKLGDLIRKGSEEAGAAAVEIETNGTRLTAGVFILGMCLGVMFSVFFTRDLTQRLRAVIEVLGNESTRVGKGSGVLSTSADALSTASAQQASAIQETASSMDEISAMVQKTSEGARSLENLSAVNETSANKGKQAIGEMLGAISAIGQGTDRIMSEIEAGNQKINEIVKVIAEIGNKTKVINDIVFQTKLLSFNASVEAARAGEHGKGFAVVAEEVGKLAVMSGDSAKEISDLLSSSLARVEGIVKENRERVQAMVVEGRASAEQGSRVAGQCQGALEEIVQRSGEVAAMINEITSAIREQTQGVQEVAKAITLLDQSTRNNASASQQTQQISRDLLEGAGSLGRIVTDLQNMVIGAAGAQGADIVPLPARPAADSSNVDRLAG